MTENVQIAIIIGCILLFALWMFKDRLGIFRFTANKDGVDAKMERHHEEKTITISGTTQYGKKNKIQVNNDGVKIDDFHQRGEGNELTTNNKE
jgi:hypothetical protein